MHIMEMLKEQVTLQSDPFSLYTPASRLTLVKEICRKSEPASDKSALAPDIQEGPLYHTPKVSL